MIIESSPTNLDPRVGVDAQSERIDDSCSTRCSRATNTSTCSRTRRNMEVPDALTYIFHLHHGVTFHDGRPLTARDVKWTMDSCCKEEFAA